MDGLLTQILETYALQFSLVLIVLAVLAFTVSVITELTKNLWVMAKVPTDVQVMVLSLALCVTGYFAYISHSSDSFTWYIFIGAVILSFFVAFLAMYGWEKMTALWSRFIKGK